MTGSVLIDAADTQVCRCIDYETGRNGAATPRWERTAGVQFTSVLNCCREKKDADIVMVHAGSDATIGKCVDIVNVAGSSMLRRRYTSPFDAASRTSCRNAAANSATTQPNSMCITAICKNV